MNEQNNPTIQTGSNPWEQKAQPNVDNWPTAYPASNVNTGATTVIESGGGGGATSAATVISGPSGGAQPYNAPPAMSPAYAPGPPQNNYGVAPPPAPPQNSGAQTMMMNVVQDIIPLAWLAVVEGPGAARGSVYSLKRETLLGRTSGEIALNMDQAISSQHLKIRLEDSEANPEQQVFVLYDMASANGVFVGDYAACQQDNANRVYRYVLKDGDFLLAGQTILVFKEVQ